MVLLQGAVVLVQATWAVVKGDRVLCCAHASADGSHGVSGLCSTKTQQCALLRALQPGAWPQEGHSNPRSLLRCVAMQIKERCNICAAHVMDMSSSRALMMPVSYLSLMMISE